MNHLKKDTVKNVIDHAVTCARAGRESNSELDSASAAFIHMLNKLSPAEMAELTALLWLGRDILIQPEQWDALVEKAHSSEMNDLYLAPKETLPQNLRHGMERLIRAAKRKKRKPADENRVHALIGEYTMEAYKRRYGENLAMKKLGDLLDQHGFLDRIEDRVLFGLQPKETDDNLEKILQGKTSTDFTFEGEL